jgi:hypothetical protein
MKKQIIVAAFEEKLSWVPAEWSPLTLVYRCGEPSERPRFRGGMPSFIHRRNPRTEEKPVVDMHEIIERAADIKYLYDSLQSILFASKPEGSMRAIAYTQNDPNGREATQWLRHIIWNYDRLADVTCFLQGHPFDHCADIIEQVATVSNGNGTFPKSGSGSIGKDDLKLVEAFWVENMGLPFDGLTQWSAGAQFFASRELIHTHSKSFYEKLLNSVLATPRSGEIMERLWLKILSTPCAE